MFRLILTALLIVPLLASAQLPTDSIVDDDETLRVNPDLVSEPDSVESSLDHPWLNLGANRVELNGADWSVLADKLSLIGRRPLRIALVGDSHIQADGATSVVRRALQQRYGSAGRGLVTPLRLAGTNQPRGYRIASTAGRWSASRLVPRRHDTEMTFTGVTVCCTDSLYDLTVSTDDGDFSRIKLYYNGSQPEIVAITAAGDDDAELDFDAECYDDGFVDIVLAGSVDGCTLWLAGSVDDEADGVVCNPTFIGGLELLGADSGVEFSAIGNNGAAFSSYAGTGLGRGLARMETDMVILSMGTNDAWGAMTDTDFIHSIDRIVSEIRRDNPSVVIMLTTPIEAQKGTGRGRRRRYAPHSKIGHFRDLMLDYCARNHLAVYDFYAVAGGEGTSTRWIDAGLFSRDRIHLSWPGYALAGQLMADALLNVFDSLNTKTQ